jgi:hypothetical protein
MSYILDALRKAERERPRHTSTRFRIAPIEEARRWWRWALAAALIGNALLLALLFRPASGPRLPSESGRAGPPPTAAVRAPLPGAVPDAPRPRVAEPGTAIAGPEAPARSASPAPAAPAPPSRSRPGESPVAHARSSAVDRPPRSSAAPTGAGAAGRAGPGAAQAPPAPRAAVAAPAARASAAVSSPPDPVAAPAGEPTVLPPSRSAEPASEVTATPPRPEPSAAAAPEAPAGRQGVTLDVLVYSDAPSERLVFINGRKYVEGQRTDQGMVVEAITPQGAMLSHEGRRFLLQAAGAR